MMTMMTAPLLCVITVVKGGGDALADCLESVTRVAYRPLRHVVVESELTGKASRMFDAHREKCAALGIEYQIFSQEPKGVYAAMNLGVAKTPAGCIIHFLNADDKFVNFQWAKELRFFEDPKVYFVYGAVQYLKAMPKDKIKLFVQPPKKITATSWLSHQGLFVRERTLRQKGFSAKYGLAADSVWASRTLSRRYGIYTPTVIAQVGLEGLSYRHPWRLTFGYCRHLLEEGRVLALIGELLSTGMGLFRRYGKRVVRG